MDNKKDGKGDAAPLTEFNRDPVSGEPVFPELRVEGRRPLVLMAARSTAVASFGTSVLEAAGFEVLAQTRGGEIVAGLGKRRPDLILTELLLDDMDVVHLCSRLRRVEAGKTVPILVISELLHTPTIRKVLADEYTDFIPTPVQWQVLVFRAHRWVHLANKLSALEEQTVEHGEVQEARHTALQASTEALQLRHFDSLTGLPNRELFVSTVGLALAQPQRYPLVALLDIDDFREVNALIGRTLGDELLKIVAKRLRNCLRSDELSSEADGARASFARFGGDQFAILIDGSRHQREGAATMAERLLAKLSDPIIVGERQFRLTGRVGIADSADLEGDGEEILVQRAETAMRYSKQQKGERVAFFESSMNELVMRRLALKGELRTALEEDQLSLCYQLLVDGEGFRPRGVEGLIRWHHPGRGMVPPEEFLAVAEESELVVEIDRWVLRAGCLQGKQWLDAGLPSLLVSLNVSMRFLEEADFAQQVLAILEETGLPPRQLQLELSERGVLPEAGRIMSQLELLAANQVHLAIDDFGTGQTSLSYLRTLPLDCIKVDRSFVGRVPEDAASAAIVSAVVAMSHHLGLKVVAEGVETEQQKLFLTGCGYDELQGFLFSKPEPAAEIARRIRELGEAPLKIASAPAGEADGEDAGEGQGPAVRTPDDASRPFHLPPAIGPVGAEGPVGPSGEPQRPVSPGHLLRLAHRDFLTGLYNRFSFDERLEHAAAHADRYGHQLALMLIDLDDFKYVNDTHGHPVGDRLLIEIGRRLQTMMRKVDTLARIGGDEFAVIYSEFREIESVAEFARRFLSTLSEPVHVEGRELRVGGSIGVTVYPQPGTRAEDLLRQADLALYKAKSQGGNKIHFFAREMDRDVQQSLALARDLGGALERSEFEINYQPLIELASGAIAGIEALLRWNHPVRGRVDPSRFIPVAESTGEIRALGTWVMRSACEQARRWSEECELEVPVSINISPVQCRDDRFAEVVLDALEEYGLPPERLHLELSERLLRTLPEDLEHHLRKLEEAGVGLALDNFGSGAAALEHFQRFRFRRLKIDKSLVWTIGEGSEGGSVLSGIVALAQKIQVQIVAEGIERPEEAAQLLAEGCELGQGFLFSKPMSGDRLLELLRYRQAHPPTLLVPGVAEPAPGASRSRGAEPLARRRRPAPLREDPARPSAGRLSQADPDDGQRRVERS